MADNDNKIWRVEVDSSVCIGSGMCAGIAPAHFRLTNNRSQPVRARIERDDLVLDASENCPVEAILVHNERTGALLAPGQQ